MITCKVVAISPGPGKIYCTVTVMRWSRFLLPSLLLVVAFFAFKGLLGTPKKNSKSVQWRRLKLASEAQTRQSLPARARRVKQRGAAAPVNISEHQAAFKTVKLTLFFIGYPRSCSTLLGTFLDAHPHIVLANEYNFFSMWPRMSPDQKTTDYIYSQLLGNSLLVSNEGGVRRQRKNVGEGELVYKLEKQWNGRYDKTVEVIGDKQAGSTTQFLSKKLAENWVDELRAITGVPVLFLHIVRNPFDNIATIAYRSVTDRKFLLQGNVLNNSTLLESTIDYYFNLVEKTAQLRVRYTALDIHSKDLLQRPKETLREICQHLDVKCSEEYLQDCVNIVFKSPSRSRNNVYWNGRLIEKVEKRMRDYLFLKQYSFDSD